MAEADIKRVLFTREAIEGRVSELGKLIAEDFAGRREGPIVLGILKGCFAFFSDLCRSLSPCPRGCEVHFARASSYEGKVTESSRSVKLSFLGGDDDVVRGRDVVIVEDIVDTGGTLLSVLGALKDLGARSVTVAALLNKSCRRDLGGFPLSRCESELPPRLDGPITTDGVTTSEEFLGKYLRYVGFECPDEFVVGYGMDYDEQYRTLGYVGVLKASVYSP